MSVRILQGDCREMLRTLPDESVHCVVTSPPYWGLRDYGVAGQLGMEPTLGEHIDTMVDVFREVRRVLRKDGTLWLNYGDCYATSPNGRSAADTKAAGNDDRTFRDKPFSTVGAIYDPEGGSKGGGVRGQNKGNANGIPKGRIVAAKRLTAGQERDDVDVGGWGARDDGLRWRGGGFLKPKDLCGIPWRLAIALQDDGWWLRQDIIWSKPNPMPESISDRCTKSHEYLFLLTKSPRYYFDQEAILEDASPNTHARLSQDVQAQVGSERAHAGGKTNGNMKAVGRKLAAAGSGTKNNESMDAALAIMPIKRNPRSVWTVPTEAFKEAHFATFPPALIEPCILAGCPHRCCGACGAPWVRQTSVSYSNPGNRNTNGPRSTERRHETAGFPVRLEKHTETLGFAPSCQCSAGIAPGVTLDPFGGSGTTGMVADRLGRSAMLIELNPEYADMARRRIQGDAGMFADVVTGTQLSTYRCDECGVSAPISELTNGCPSCGRTMVPADARAAE